MTFRIPYFNQHVSFQEHSILFSNYLLILYAFFLPIAPKIATKIFISAAIMMFFGGNVKEKFFNALRDKIILSVVLFYAMYILWTFGSEHISTALFKLKEFKYILHIIIIHMILQQRFVFKILGGFISGVALSAFVSYLLFFNFPVSFWLQYIPFIELHSAMHINVPFMVSYTAYSISLSISASIILYLLLNAKNKSGYLKLALSLLFIGISIIIFLIASRLGYILYAFSTAFTIMFVFHKHLLKATLIIILFVGITYFIAYANSPVFKNRFSAIIDETKNSLNASYTSGEGMRIAYYLYSWEVIKSNPLFGVGTGDHIEEVFKVIEKRETDAANKNILYMNYHSGDHASFDSEYLDTLVQFGIIGFIIFLNVIYQIVRYVQLDLRLKYIQYLLALTIIIISLPSIILIPSEVGKVLTLIVSLTLAYPSSKKQSAKN